MCRDFGIPQTQLGLYSGLLASCFPFAQFLSSVLWGRISDKFGRKPAIICGLAGVACATLAFGLASSYAAAFAARFAGGLLNGNVGVLKSYLGRGLFPLSICLFPSFPICPSLSISLSLCLLPSFFVVCPE